MKKTKEQNNDIAKRKKIEETLKEREEHGRIFASYQQAISELRQFYVKEVSFKQMLQKTTDLFIKNFGYYMAWYGELKEDEKIIIPRVWAGKYEKYLDGLRLELDDSKDAKCAMSLAIVRERPFGYTDLEHDKDFKKWRPLALKYGYRSNQAIPLIIGGKSIGAFLIYSTRPRAFSRDLIRYLAGITNELSTIVGNITARRKAEEELNKYYEHLEEMVEKRTAELKTANEQLQREISESKKTMEALRDSEERYRDLSENINNLIQSVAPDGSFIYVNRTWREILGYSEEEIPSLSLFNVIHPDSQVHCKNIFQRLVAGETVKNFEAKFLTKEGKTVLLEGSANCRFKKGKPVATRAIFRDITKRKKAEENLRKAYTELKEAQTQLIQSEKLASIGQLAAGAAHEVNNPLTAISGEAEMLLRKKDKDTKDAARTIVEQAKRIKTITQRLLEFSRKREVKLEPLNLNDAVKESLSLLSYQAKIENIKIIKEFDPDLPKVLADNSQIQEVFLNIMLNAIQAMGKAGSLTIRTRCEKIIEYKRRKTDKFKKGQEIAIIEFKDTGYGMDEETLKKVFDPFFTTKEESTGLGLFICYGIMDDRNGIIEAQSKLGEGSTFIVKLPVMGGGGK